MATQASGITAPGVRDVSVKGYDGMIGCPTLQEDLMSSALPISASRTASGGHHSGGGVQHKPRSDAGSDDDDVPAMSPVKGGSVRAAISTAQVSLRVVLPPLRRPCAVRAGGRMPQQC
jgi:hypothetical protein